MDVVRIMKEIRESIQRKREQGIYTEEEVDALTELRLRTFGEEVLIDPRLVEGLRGTGQGWNIASDYLIKTAALRARGLGPRRLEEDGAPARPPVHRPHREPPGPAQPVLRPSPPREHPRDRPPAGRDPGAAPPLPGPGGRARRRPPHRELMRLAVVVQRYGTEVVGGAELHARWIAQRLAARHEVEVLTTCAVDYLTWENVYPAGETEVARRARAPLPGGEAPHRGGVRPALGQGPLLRAFGPRRAAVDGGARAGDPRARRPPPQARRRTTTRWSSSPIATGRPITACRSRRTRASWSRPRRTIPPSACGCSSRSSRSPPPTRSTPPEERDSILKAAGRTDLPGEVVGVGIEGGEPSPVDEMRRKLDLLGDYIVYVGRIEREKGCSRLFANFLQYVQQRSPNLNLVLVGKAVLPIPTHVNITHLGVLSDADKLAAIRGSRLLVHPSPFESLSMALLEALDDGAPRAGQRQVRGAARAGDAGQRRPVLRDPGGVRREPCTGCSATRRRARPWAAPAARTSSATTPGT